MSDIQLYGRLFIVCCLKMSRVLTCHVQFSSAAGHCSLAVCCSTPVQTGILLLKQIVLHYNKLKLIQDLSGSLEAHMGTFWNVHSSNQFLMEVNDPIKVDLYRTTSELFFTIKGITY